MCTLAKHLFFSPSRLPSRLHKLPTRLSQNPILIYNLASCFKIYNFIVFASTLLLLKTQWNLANTASDGDALNRPAFSPYSERHQRCTWFEHGVIYGPSSLLSLFVFFWQFQILGAFLKHLNSFPERCAVIQIYTNSNLLFQAVVDNESLTNMSIFLFAVALHEESCAAAPWKA